MKVCNLEVYPILKSLRFHAIITMAISVIYLLVIFSMKTKENESVPLMMLIFLAGATGGLLNSYLRIKNIPLSEENQLTPHLNFMAILQLYITPFVSGFLAIIFYGICISGVISGEIFPKFQGLDLPYTNVADIFINVKPEARIDGIKAIMIGFITGFSERLVPNVIDKIVKDLETKGI